MTAESGGPQVPSADAVTGTTGPAWAPATCGTPPVMLSHAVSTTAAAVDCRIIVAMPRIMARWRSTCGASPPRAARSLAGGTGSASRVLPAFHRAGDHLDRTCPCVPMIESAFSERELVHSWVLCL